ncbi:MAG: SDR family NAD(P)-dependent oxidoreductase [Candidatus Dormibacteraceae bacterium]
MDLGLSRRKAIVTGGSRGLGRAISEELLREGAELAICARDAEQLSAAAARLSEIGDIHSRPADVTDPAQAESFVAWAAETMGGIDVLVNNAGRAHPGDFEDLTDADWRDDLEVKLFPMIRMSRAVLPHMRSRGGGRIININAVYGRYPDPAFFATSVNRAACLSLTKTLAIELAGEAILVNSVNIGFVVTDNLRNVHRLRAPELPEEEFFRRLIGGEVPMERVGRPEEVSGVVAFLAGARASYVTGASIDVAGGMGRYL